MVASSYQFRSNWFTCDAQMGEGVEIELDWDLAAQAAPELRGQSALRSD